MCMDCIYVSDTSFLIYLQIEMRLHSYYTPTFFQKQDEYVQWQPCVILYYDCKMTSIWIYVLKDILLSLGKNIKRTVAGGIHIKQMYQGITQVNDYQNGTHIPRTRIHFTVEFTNSLEPCTGKSPQRWVY